MKTLYLLALLLLCFSLPSQVSASNLVRSKCKRVGEFKEPYTEYSLLGHVTSKITVPDVISCSFECLSTEQCLSYNFKDEHDNETNICELNDATKEARPNDFHNRTGYKYYDTQKAPSKCASSPCLNGGSCVETCLIGPQITCECKLGTTGDRCQSFKADLFKYQIIFPNKNGTSFAAVDLDTTVTLFTMTLCMWIQTIDTGPFHLFSYVTWNGTKELSFGCESIEDCEFILLQESRKVSLISLNDGKWRHVCLTWGSAAGDWNLYFDGALRAYGSGLGTGLAIHGGGRLVLGQEQKNCSFQSFNATKSFAGNITQVMLRNEVLEKSPIKSLSKDCYCNTSSKRSVVFWIEFRIKIRGPAQVGWNLSCNATGEQSRFILNFPARSVSDTVIPPVSMPSLSAGTICWWMKNAINNYNVFSYVAPYENNPTLDVYFGIFWKFHLGLTSPKLGYECPLLGDSYWHHFCVAWDSSTIEWFFYLDGVPQISQTKGHISGYAVQGGGTFHLGQHVQNGAYKLNKAYEGMLTAFNIWTKPLSPRTVAALAEEPGGEGGDALSWTMFREGIAGEVKIYHNYGLWQTVNKYTQILILF